ncbi:MAG: Flp family type IVb pilin [Actinobacteria bacterium]|nr:Flp family type IVb pilin [Actinomycetota bacterium]
MELIKSIWSEEEGQGLAEYGLILALIAVVCILALTGLGEAIVDKLDEVVDGLAPAAPAGN